MISTCDSSNVVVFELTVPAVIVALLFVPFEILIALLFDDLAVTLVFKFTV